MYFVLVLSCTVFSGGPHTLVIRDHGGSANRVHVSPRPSAVTSVIIEGNPP